MYQFTQRQTTTSRDSSIVYRSAFITQSVTDSTHVHVCVRVCLCTLNVSVWRVSCNDKALP